MCFQLVISLFLGALQQLSGINFVATYASSLSKQFFTGELSYAMPSIINFIIIPAIVASYFLLQSVGRRPILFYGTLVAGISNLIIAIAFSIQNSDHATSTILLFIGFFLFMIDFGLSLGPVVYLYIPEIIGPRLISFAVISTWVGAALPIILFPIIAKSN
jgi:SP family sugar:H+ symporter-like MFS transporter